jgi:hypothetical protein
MIFTKMIGTFHWKIVFSVVYDLLCRPIFMQQGNSLVDCSTCISKPNVSLIKISCCTFIRLMLNVILTS